MRNAYALLGVMFLVVFGIAFLLVDRSEQGTEEDPTSNPTLPMLTITSPQFGHNDSIPSKYTCDGDNLNPELSIVGVPEGTETLVLLMDDPDIPEEVKSTMNIEKFDHWVLYNIPPETGVIEVGTPVGEEGMNSRGDAAYSGPCPPKEYEPTEHRYFFRLYAVDTTLSFDGPPTLDEVRTAIEGHVLEESELVGLYERN